MQITHDHSCISRTDREFISRGYACESLYSLRLSYLLAGDWKAGKDACPGEADPGSDAWDAYITDKALQRSAHMGRIAATMAQNFKIYQFDGREAVPYHSDWDLFFWCSDFSQTMRGLLSGRDYSYFTLTFNSRHSPKRRQEIYEHAMHILRLLSDDENLHVAVQYTAVKDDARIRQDAGLTAPKIVGRKCIYGGMEGRVEDNGGTLFFRKKRSRKYAYRLTDAEILLISWQLSV